MNCKKAKGLILSEYADGLMRGHELEELESHLRACYQCRSFASDIVSAGKLFRSAGRTEAPAVVWDRIRARISESLVKPDILRMKPAFVAVAAAVVFLFFLATARIVSDRVYHVSISAGEEIISMASLQNPNPAGEYDDIGTSIETFLL